MGVGAGWETALTGARESTTSEITRLMEELNLSIEGLVAMFRAMDDAGVTVDAVVEALEAVARDRGWGARS